MENPLSWINAGDMFRIIFHTLNGMDEYVFFKMPVRWVYFPTFFAFDFVSQRCFSIRNSDIISSPKQIVLSMFVHMRFKTCGGIKRFFTDRTFMSVISDELLMYFLHMLMEFIMIVKRYLTHVAG